MNPKAKERVTVLGEEVNDNDKHWAGRSSGAFWGFIFVAAGVVLLLNTLNLLSWNVWEFVVRFWPLILIIWGIKIVVIGSRLAKGIVDILAFLLIALIVLFAIHEANPSLVSGLPDEFQQIFQLMRGVQP